MCGIFGINERNEELARHASQTIAYRGPDQHAVWVDDAVSLGFNRLAIIDLNPRASQPMWDEEHRVGIIFNGEIYNYKELKRELAAEFDFRTTSDTEVLLYGYKKYGPGFAERLRGMYAYAIYDTTIQKLLLFRDHAGIKPLLYYYKDGCFVFASEMKAIAAALGQKDMSLSLDHDAVRTYFALGYIPAPLTMYKNVNKLPRGTYLEFDLPKREVARIVRLSSPTASVESEADLFGLIEQSILDHLIADVPVGVFFSGGTDSSLIASVLHAHGVNLETFSISVAGRNADQKYFLEISKLLSLKSHVYDFTAKEFNDVYRSVMDNVDEPNADISIFPTYFVSNKAAGRVKVVLSGEGGDELFFGYRRQRALARARSCRDPESLTLLDHLFLRTPTFKGKNYLFERLFLLTGRPLSAFLLFMSPSRDRTSVAAWAAGKKTIAIASRDPLYFDRDLYLENDLLRKTDFATSLNSIEGRVPLLDPRVVQSAPRFEHAYHPQAASKPILKRMLEKFLPHHLVYRGKSGFGMSLPAMLPHAPMLGSDLDHSITFLKNRGVLFARLPRTRTELVRRYPNLCFALICLYYAIKNNESLLEKK